MSTPEGSQDANDLLDTMGLDDLESNSEDMNCQATPKTGENQDESSTAANQHKTQNFESTQKAGESTRFPSAPGMRQTLFNKEPNAVNNKPPAEYRDSTEGQLNTSNSVSTEHNPANQHGRVPRDQNSDSSASNDVDKDTGDDDDTDNYDKTSNGENAGDDRSATETSPEDVANENLASAHVHTYERNSSSDSGDDPQDEVSSRSESAVGREHRERQRSTVKRKREMNASSRIKRQDKTQDIVSDNMAEADKNKKASSKKGRARIPKISKAQHQKNEKGANEVLGFMKFKFGTDSIADAKDPEGQSIPEIPPFSTEGKSRERQQALANLLKDVPKEFQRYAAKYKQDVNRACKSFPKGVAKVDKTDGFFSIKGLGSSLRHHQLLGSAWMMRMEMDKTTKGGMNCDHMGFGKTIQTIAMMASNKAVDSEHCPTLVVCPSHLASVWLEELQKHLTPDFLQANPILLINANNQMRGSSQVNLLKACFCVISTYAAVRDSMCAAKCPATLTDDGQITEWYLKEGKQKLGLFHRFRWHRVVLDECTYIKNHKSESARSCCLLQSDYRWLLSGTPLTNSVYELYSYINFLGYHQVGGSFQHFVHNFVESENSQLRLQCLLCKIMLRRTHQDRILGMRIIKLPTSWRNQRMITLSKLERVVYDVCNKRFIYWMNLDIKRLHKETKQGDKVKTSRIARNMMQVVMRLRQIASHPLLAGETIRKILLPEDREEIRSVLGNVPEEEPQYHLVSGMRHILSDTDLGEGDHENDNESTFKPMNRPNGPSQISGEQILEIFDELKGIEDETERVCVICKNHPLTPTAVPMETSCGHLYCSTCLEDYQFDCAEKALDQTPCYECKKIFETAYRVTKKPVARQQTQKTLKKKRENQDLSWIDHKPMIPSSKMQALQYQIKTWFAEEDEVNIIVYTQFKPIVKLVEKLCKDQNWLCATYFGEVSQSKREANIVWFHEGIEPKKILIATLQAGGIGLNLTCATRIAILEPWWNFAVEEQAFCRTFRMGQTKETCVMRMVAEETIDMKMLRMQEQKQQAIDAALNEDGSRPDLTLNERMSLFGDVRYDDEGHPYIIPAGKDYVQPDLEPGTVHLGSERTQPIRPEQNTYDSDPDQPGKQQSQHPRSATVQSEQPNERGKPKGR